jgi:peptide/nickel transport system substrate-binding protein
MLTRRRFLKAGASVAGTLGASRLLSFNVSAQVEPHTIVWATAGSIARLNPQLTFAWPDIYATENIYDALTRRDADHQLVPGLATEWKLVNETTWQFKLRPGVKFHSGEPFTAADVKFTIERAIDPAARTVIVGLFNVIDRVDIVNDLTVNIVTKRPDPLQPARHAVWGNGSILPARYFQQIGADAFERNPIGTGPYRVVEWVKDDHLTLEANKDYWGGAPNARTIVMKPRSEPASRIAALLSGEANWIDLVPPDQIERLKNTSGIKLARYTLSGYVSVVIHAGKPPLDRKPLRQAISLAIDRATIIKELVRDQGVVPSGFIPRGDFAYNATRPPLAYDRQRAATLVRQSGYSGEELVCDTPQRDLPVAEAVVAMLQQVGLKARAQLLEDSVRAQKIRDKAYALFVANPSSPMGDPDGILWRSLGPGGTYATWREAEFDRLGEEARYSLDPAQRRRDYERMEEILLDHFPFVPIYQPVLSYALQRTIEFKASPSSTVDLRKGNLSFST